MKPVFSGPLAGAARLPQILLLASALLSSACGKKEPVLARVGSDPITLSDFHEELDGRAPGQNEYLDTLPGRKELLELVVRRKIVLAEAKRAAFERRPDIRKKLEEMEADVERQRRRARERMLIGEFFRFLQERDLKVTDEETKQFWSSEKEARASHILVSDETTARKVSEEVKKGGSFAQLAKKYSEDVSTARQGGDLGFLMKGTLVPEFEDALYSLKVGETSDVVSSPYGYHILRKTAEKPLSAQKYEDVAEKIQGVLQKKKFQTWVDQTRSRYNIKVDTAALENLNPSAPEPPVPSPAE